MVNRVCCIFNIMYIIIYVCKYTVDDKLYIDESICKYIAVKLIICRLLLMLNARRAFMPYADNIGPDQTAPLLPAYRIYEYCRICHRTVKVMMRLNVHADLDLYCLLMA